MSKVVTCNGCFDGLHAGHLFFLGYCLAQGDRLIIGINSDEYIRRKKGREPVPAQDRIFALKELGFVEEVYVFEQEDPSEFIRVVRPSVHCIGEEYKERGKAPEIKICHIMGVRVVYIPRVGKWSSTLLRG